jgi:hypothetical protein
VGRTVAGVDATVQFIQRMDGFFGGRQSFGVGGEWHGLFSSIDILRDEISRIIVVGVDDIAFSRSWQGLRHRLQSPEVSLHQY